MKSNRRRKKKDDHKVCFIGVKRIFLIVVVVAAAARQVSLLISLLESTTPVAKKYLCLEDLFVFVRRLVCPSCLPIKVMTYLTKASSRLSKNLSLDRRWGNLFFSKMKNGNLRNCNNTMAVLAISYLNLLSVLVLPGSLTGPIVLKGPLCYIKK